MIRIEIVNDRTGSDSVANYKYRVLINTEVAKEGEIKHHLAASGWQGLLSLLNEQINGDKFKR